MCVNGCLCSLKLKWTVYRVFNLCIELRNFCSRQHKGNTVDKSEKKSEVEESQKTDMEELKDNKQISSTKQNMTLKIKQ